MLPRSLISGVSKTYSFLQYLSLRSYFVAIIQKLRNVFWPEHDSQATSYASGVSDPVDDDDATPETYLWINPS